MALWHGWGKHVIRAARCRLCEFAEARWNTCYIYADRRLQNAYGKRLRQRVSDNCDLPALVKMHGAGAFGEGVGVCPLLQKLIESDFLTIVKPDRPSVGKTVLFQDVPHLLIVGIRVDSKRMHALLLAHLFNEGKRRVA